MFVKILIHKHKKLNLKLDTFLTSIQKPFQIIVNNYQLNADLVNRGFNSHMLSDIFPYDHPKSIEIDREVTKTLTKLQDLFSDIRYKNFELFPSLENQILDSLNSLYKFENIIKSNINCIFIFENPIFLQLVLQNNLSNNPNIDSISFLNSDLNSMSLHEFYSMIRAKKNNISTVFEKLTKFLPFRYIFSRLLFYKIQNKIPKQSTELSPPVDFFLTPSTEYVYKPTIQLQNQMYQNKIPYNTFSFDTQTSKTLKNENLDIVDLFKESWLFSQIIKNSKEYLDTIKKFHKIISEKNIKILKLDNMFNPILEQLSFNISIMILTEKILDQNKSKSIVVTNDGNRIGNSIISASSSKNISSYSIPALIISSTQISKFLFTADKICLYGNHAKDILLKLGYDDKRLFLTGNPKYDYIPKSNFSNSKSKLSKIYPLRGKKLILVGFTRWGKNDEDWIPQLIDFCNKNNYDLIIKIHPIYKILMKEIHENKINLIEKQCVGLNYKITYDIDPTLLLESADLIISDHSNFLIEGILLGKQFVMVNLQNENLDFLKKSLNLPKSNFVSDYAQLENIIIKRFSNSENFKISDESFLKWALNFNFQNDGKSVERILNLILEKNLD
jgi:hypothetical protein